MKRKLLKNVSSSRLVPRHTIAGGQGSGNGSGGGPPNLHFSPNHNHHMVRRSSQPVLSTTGLNISPAMFSTLPKLHKNAVCFVVL